MNSDEIIYDLKKATEEEIYSNLKICDKEFIPPLSSRVNLEEYAHKLFEKSVSFEAWIDQRLIGMVAAYFNNIRDLNGYITNVCVEKEYKGKNIAFKLMSNCIEYAKENNFRKIYLEVNRSNLAAIKLYEKFHFKAEKYKDEYMVMVLNISSIN